MRRVGLCVGVVAGVGCIGPTLDSLAIGVAECSGFAGCMAERWQPQVDPTTWPAGYPFTTSI